MCLFGENQATNGASANSKNNKETNKDLLRLEKDCFEGIFDQKKDESQNEFQIKRLLSPEDRKLITPKPVFRNMPKSDCNFARFQHE